jgi:hypothetical protein
MGERPACRDDPLLVAVVDGIADLGEELEPLRVPSFISSA